MVAGLGKFGHLPVLLWPGKAPSHASISPLFGSGELMIPFAPASATPFRQAAELLRQEV